MTTGGSEEKVLAFRVADQEFGVGIRHVREVIATPTLAALPNARDPVKGVFNLRGHIVTAVDGAAALGVPSPEDRRRRAIVADVEGRALAILVDAASEVLTLARDAVRPSPYADDPDNPGLVRGIALHKGRPLALLDLSRLLPSQAVAGAVEAAAITEVPR